MVRRQKARVAHVAAGAAVTNEQPVGSFPGDKGCRVYQLLPPYPLRTIENSEAIFRQRCSSFLLILKLGNVAGEVVLVATFLSFFFFSYSFIVVSNVHFVRPVCVCARD